VRSALQKRGDSSKTQLAARGITAFQKGKCYPNKKFKMPVEGAVRVYKTGTTRHESGRRKKAMVILPGFSKYAENFKKDNTQSGKKSSAFTTGKKRSKFYGTKDFAKLFFLITNYGSAISASNKPACYCRSSSNSSPKSYCRSSWSFETAVSIFFNWPLYILVSTWLRLTGRSVSLILRRK
jgi:hypothetical protein